MFLPQRPNFWTEGSLGHEKETYFFEIYKNGLFRVIYGVLLPHYLVFVGHIIWIAVFGLFDWYQFAYHFRLKWLMLINTIFLNVIY